MDALAKRERIRRDAPLVIFAVVVAGLDRRRQGGDGREVRVVELAVQTDAADRRRTEARAHADQLVLFTRDDVVRLPGHEENADELVGKTKWLEQHALVTETAQQLARVLRR